MLAPKYMLLVIGIGFLLDTAVMWFYDLYWWSRAAKGGVGRIAKKDDSHNPWKLKSCPPSSPAPFR